MAEIRNVTGTAFVVAEFRAEENWEKAPLYLDPVVGLFLNEESRAAATRVATGFPLCRDMIRLRTKYLDDMLDRQLRSGARQVVVLGAGLDTRAVRKPATGVTYFEIDDGETLDIKRRAYEQHGIDVNLKFIPGNYVTDGLLGMLRRNGFDFDLPTYFIWEGNTMYLPLEIDKQILVDLRTHVKWFRLSFDYLAESVIAKSTGDHGVTTLVERFAAMGAPWVTGIRDVGALAHELGLAVIEDFRTAELSRMYWPGRAMTSPIFNLYSVCSLGV